MQYLAVGLLEQVPVTIAPLSLPVPPLSRHVYNVILYATAQLQKCSQLEMVAGNAPLCAKC